MKSAVETLSPTRVRLRVEVPFEEFKPNLDAAYKEISKQIVVPGFRKGKVPPALIDQRVGRQAVLGQAVNDAVPQLYTEALQENKVEPLGQPELNLDELLDGEDIAFSAEIEVKPDLTLPEYEGLEVNVDDADVSEEDVEAQLQDLRERFSSLQTVDRAAADDDYLTIDLSASQDGQLIEDAQASGMSYQVGSGSLFEGLDDAVRGMVADEEKTFQTTLVGGDYGGQEVDVSVTVQAVREQHLPELNDEFAEVASEFDTIEGMRADQREQLLRSRRLEQAQAARDAVLEKLLELTEVPLPEQALNEELEARRSSIHQQLQQIGLSLEQYLEMQQQTQDEFDADLDNRAREAMRGQFVLDQMASNEEISVTQEELTQAIVQRAQQSGVSPQDYMQQVIDNDQVSVFVRDVARSKALASVVESAQVTDESGRVVELNRLQPDGSIAEDGAEAEADDQRTAEATQTEGTQTEATQPTDGPREEEPTTAAETDATVEAEDSAKDEASAEAGPSDRAAEHTVDPDASGEESDRT